MSGRELDLSHVLQGGYFNKTLREWHSTNTFIKALNFILPLFIHESDDTDQEIASLPGVRRLGINRVREFLDPVVANGLRCVLLFGVIETESLKDERGSFADNAQSSVIRCIPRLREWYPDLLIACDVCLCAYTVHGHCGVFHANSEVSFFNNNFEIRLEFAQLGKIWHFLGKNPFCGIYLKI
jgi:porphobilinogen synthase